jgi:hypothetical protein
MRHLQLWQPENRQAFAALNIHSFLQRDARISNSRMPDVRRRPFRWLGRRVTIHSYRKRKGVSKQFWN